MIRMRTNKDANAKCCECGNDRINSLEMFDVCICGQIFTICDLCSDMLLQKTLVASCNVNCKVKSPHDMAIIRKRFAVKMQRDDTVE